MTSPAKGANLRLSDARDEGAALLIVDVQQAIDDTEYWGPRSNPLLEERLLELLACWRGGEGLVVHVRHFSHTPGSPYRCGQPGADFMACATPRPGERIVTKHVDSAFVGTDLEPWLRRHGASRLVVAGVSSAHSVSTTVRHAACLGFAVSVVDDACAAFDVKDHERRWEAEEVHRFSLALLEDGYATVCSTRTVVQRF